MTIPREFFSKRRETLLFPPAMVESFVTAENINQLIGDNGFGKEIDLFSLDVDGMDYWLWKAMDAANPRVVVTEYQDCFSTDQALTVPYKADFNRFDIDPDYFGASLAAFVKLGQEKDYRLVGANRLQYNAFFMRNDVGADLFPEISVEKVSTHPIVKKHAEERLEKLMKFDWEEV